MKIIDFSVNMCSLVTTIDSVLIFDKVKYREIHSLLTYQFEICLNKITNKCQYVADNHLSADFTVLSKCGRSWFWRTTISIMDTDCTVQ